LQFCVPHFVQVGPCEIYRAAFQAVRAMFRRTISTSMKHKLLLGLLAIAYTSVVIFLTTTVHYRFVQEEIKAHYAEEYCEVVHTYTGEAGGEDWEELMIILEEITEERDALQQELDEGIDKLLAEDGGSDADAYINLFYNLADPINWVFTFIIATFIALFYLAFYSAKLWIQRHFRGKIDD
jgi:hypothetical protein